MTENKKEIFTKADFLTPSKFSKKYNIPSRLVTLAASVLYKKNTSAKTKSGNLTPVVVKNRSTHNSTSSQYQIHPAFHSIVLKEIETQKRLEAKKAKGAEK